MDMDAFDILMRAHGWVLFDAVVPADQLDPIGRDIEASVARCGEYQIKAGLGRADGTAHHAVGQYDSLDAFLAKGWLDAFVSRYFDGAPYILHAFNPATVAPATTSYLHKIHRDVRTHAGEFRMVLNMLVMVDAFTLENGATHVLSGSHDCATPPCADLFWAQSDRLVGRAGSIVLFDSNLWHAAGHNASGQIRRALTLSFSRPFVKQQMDYPRFLGEAYGRGLSSKTRQLLGYEAMTPTSYEEWYRPRETRLYKETQG